MNKYQRILVPVDGSDLARSAIEHTILLAKAFDSSVIVMSVVAIDPYVGVDFYKVAPVVTDHLLEAEASAQGNLDQIKAEFESKGISTEVKIIREEPTSQGIINIADEVNADLIVMASHGRTGFKRLVMGSVAEKVISESPIPVLVVKQPEIE